MATVYIKKEKKNDDINLSNKNKKIRSKYLRSKSKFSF